MRCLEKVRAVKGEQSYTYTLSLHTVVNDGVVHLVAKHNRRGDQQTNNLTLVDAPDSPRRLH